MRQSDGKYHMHGVSCEFLIGSRAQVWHETACKTSGGLVKRDLMMNKHGRIVSKLKHATAKKEKRLEKAGYKTKKGTFGFIKEEVSSKRKTSKKGSKGKKSKRGTSSNK